jgi:enoyl-CoA hydratase/carnithine racemase
MTPDRAREGGTGGEEGVGLSRPRPGVAVLTIASHPLGVLRLSVKRALRHVLSTLEADPAVRCVVLTGVGKAFSVGSDVKEFKRDSGWLLEAEFEENALNNAIAEARFPVIAACNGHTLGGGLVLALACDIRIVSASATFGVPEVRVGAFASGSGTQRLAQHLGRGRALYFLLTGRIVSANEALSLGLVEEVLPDSAMMDRALDLAAELAVLPAAAVGASKRCLNIGMRHGWAEGMALEATLAVEVGLSDDAVEGQRAFVEKRPPRFQS